MFHNQRKNAEKKARVPTISQDSLSINDYKLNFDDKNFQPIMKTAKNTNFIESSKLQLSIDSFTTKNMNGFKNDVKPSKDHMKQSNTNKHDLLTSSRSQITKNLVSAKLQTKYQDRNDLAIDEQKILNTENTDIKPHIENFHETENIDAEVIKCYSCNETFAQWKDLIRHITRVHEI